jgi:hypothetical protein
VPDQRLPTLGKHQAVVQALLITAQIDRFRSLGAHDEAEHVDVEVARGVQIGDHVLGMGDAHYVEARVLVGEVEAHRISAPGPRRP